MIIKFNSSYSSGTNLAWCRANPAVEAIHENVPCNCRIAFVVEESRARIQRYSDVMYSRPPELVTWAASRLVHLVGVELQHLQVRQQQLTHIELFVRQLYWN